MFTQSCCCFKNRTRKKIEKYSPISNLLVDLKKICGSSIFYGFEKDLPI